MKKRISKKIITLLYSKQPVFSGLIGIRQSFLESCRMAEQISFTKKHLHH
jgi:hypothetical protein